MEAFMTITVKKLAKLIFIFFILQLSSTHAANTDEHERFIKTKACLKCDLSNDIFEGEYPNSLLDGAILNDCDFVYTNFDFSQFNGSFLTKAHANSFWNPWFYSQSTFRQASFIGAMLNYSNFSNVEFSGANFMNANLKYANFENANLSNTNFLGAIVDGLKLKNAILIGSNISDDQLNVVASKDCVVLPNGELYQENPQSKCVF